MLLACFKDDAIRYVRWLGESYNYPRWFTDNMMGIVYGPDGYTLRDMYNKPHTLREGDYFIMNQYDEIAVVSFKDFVTYFATVNNEVCCFLDKRIFWHHVYGDLDNGEPGSVVIINEDGGTKEVEPDEFYQHVHTYLTYYR